MGWRFSPGHIHITEANREEAEPIPAQLYRGTARLTGNCIPVEERHLIRRRHKSMEGA